MDTLLNIILFKHNFISDIIDIVKEYFYVYSHNISVLEGWTPQNHHYLFGMNRYIYISTAYQETDIIKTENVLQLLQFKNVKIIYYHDFNENIIGPMASSLEASVMGKLDCGYFFYYEVTDFAMGDTESFHMKLYVAQSLHALLIQQPNLNQLFQDEQQILYLQLKQEK